MPKYSFQKAISDEEARLAKNDLKFYYRWKYGYGPPADWEADHQVEQMIPNYERFGPRRIHSLQNLIMVPRELNHAKNLAYNKTWDQAPPGFRHLIVPTEEDRRFGNSLPQRIRELVYKRSIFMRDDDEAWHFLTEFSRCTLILLIEQFSADTWVKTPPNWLKQNPLWLNRLKDTVLMHPVYIKQFMRAKARREAEAASLRAARAS